jgi:hypothetical protein
LNPSSSPGTEYAPEKMPISATLIASPGAEAEPAAVAGDEFDACGGDDLALQAPRGSPARTIAAATIERASPRRFRVALLIIGPA